jgi:predicted CopG family antitoxin
LSTGKTIRISEETYQELANKGTLEDSFDSVIRKLISEQKTTEVKK